MCYFPKVKKEKRIYVYLRFFNDTLKHSYPDGVVIELLLYMM